MPTALPVASRRDRHRHRSGAVARTGARARRRRHREAQHLQNRSLEFGLAITIPAAVGLALLPEPIIALVFERGAFTRETTLLTSTVLAAFALGLPAFVLTKIFTPAFYAREDMRTPLWASDRFGCSQHCRKSHPVSAHGRDRHCHCHQFRGLGLGALSLARGLVSGGVVPPVGVRQLSGFSWCSSLLH
jgi:hypothetical protein